MASPLVIAHPSAELYGADLQLVETVRQLAARSVPMVTVLPENGPLVELLRAAGTRVVIHPFPVLRKSLLSPRRLPGLAVDASMEIAAATRWLRRIGADRLLVNTIVIPWWIAAGRAAGIPVITHVHEAEAGMRRLFQLGLTAPLALSDRIVANSQASCDLMCETLPMLAERAVVVHNGVEGPPTAPLPPRARATGDPARLAFVGRLGPRKGTDLALDAVGLLRAEHRDVTLDVYGSTFTGYEWYERELRERAERPDLAGAVTFHGYVRPIWQALADADVILMPSRLEPFGNVAAETLLARRPLVAAKVQALSEVVIDGQTGLLAAPEDPVSLRDSVTRFLDDPAFAAEVAIAGRRDASDRFSPERYGADMWRAIMQ